MGFKESVLEDIDQIFFDEDFFGSVHSFDGEEITVIVDEEGLDDIKRTWKDEVHKNPVLLFVMEKDMKRKLTINSDVEYDGKMYFVKSLAKSDGVWKMLLERSTI